MENRIDPCAQQPHGYYRRYPGNYAFRPAIRHSQTITLRVAGDHLVAGPCWAIDLLVFTQVFQLGAAWKTRLGIERFTGNPQCSGDCFYLLGECCPCVRREDEDRPAGIFAVPHGDRCSIHDHGRGGLGQGGGAALGQLAGDDHALDLAGAFPDTLDA